MRISDLVDATRAFEEEAHQILAVHESSKSRVVSLNQTYEKLDKLNLKQEELFRQAIRCAEMALFRAAHVMAWAGAMDILLQKLEEDFSALQAVRPKWRGEDVYEMAEWVSEYQFVDVLQPLKLATKNQVKTLHGLLHTRNQCAHPTDYFPDLNDTLGYVSGVMTAVARFQEKNATP